MNVHEKARVLLDAFVEGQRKDGTRFWRVKYDHPYHDLAQDMMYVVHGEGEILPDDYLYRYAVEALHILAENDGSDPDTLGFEAIEADKSRADLIDWLKNAPDSVYWVDSVREDLGPGKSVMDDIRDGQWAQRHDVFCTVVSWLEHVFEEEQAV